MEEKSLLIERADPVVKTIYRATLLFPYKYQSSIGDQLRRSSLSVILNIVEGGARKSAREKQQFLNISFGSLKETKYLVEFSYEFKLLQQDPFRNIMIDLNNLAKIMYGLLYRKE